MSNSSTAAVRSAFNCFRQKYVAPRPPLFVRYPSDADPMDETDGLTELVDGPAVGCKNPQHLARMEKGALPARPHLWIVRPEDVVHADKNCPFGASRTSEEATHTNLTGGKDAFAGGEFMMIDNGVMIVSGDSGRYGPRSAQEMRDVAQAFKDSGYVVYSMGFDEGTNRPLKFVGPRPELI